MWFFILVFFHLLQLAAIKLGRYGEDLLFYLYYMNGGDVLQLLAAVELYVQTTLSVLHDLIFCSNEVMHVILKKIKQCWREKLSWSEAGKLFQNTSSYVGSVFHFFHSYSRNQMPVSSILQSYKAVSSKSLWMPLVIKH